MRVLLCCLLFAASLIAADQPNIVLIVADDLGSNDLGCYGSKEHHTPNLDRLAEQGVRFTCAYAAQSLGSPSRAALLTGKYPARLHLTGDLPGRADAPSQKLLQPRVEGQLPLEENTIAEVLKERGYATGFFGKWDLGGSEFGPKAQGFDAVFLADSTSNNLRGEQGENAIARAATEFIEANKGRPFFCCVPYNNSQFSGTKPELVTKNATAFNPTYAATVEALDDSVGILLAKIESLGVADRTMIIFTSGNGGLHMLEGPGTPATHNGPFRAGKGFLYEGGVRVPLIARWPEQIPAERVNDSTVMLTDVMPTVMDFTGIDPAKTIGPLDGVSIAKLMRGEGAPARSLFWHMPNYTNQGGRPASAMREGDWKLIENLEDLRCELFNLAQDPSESKDLASQEPERVLAMKAKLDAWRARVGAQMPRPNPTYDAQKHDALYVRPDPSTLKAGATAESTAKGWAEWRAAMNAAVQNGEPVATPEKGIISMPARNAVVHATKMKYEPQSFKNTLGYWVNQEDWAEWTVNVPAAGRYELDILQGCGNGSGGAEVEVSVGETSFTTTVVETGHFQHFIRRSLGLVSLPVGNVVVSVKPKSKKGAAVMDLREVRLVPVAEGLK